MRRFNSLTETLNHILLGMYSRPAMYAQTGMELEAALHVAHMLWIHREGRVPEYLAAKDNKWADLPGSATSPAYKWRQQHPDGSEQDALRYVADRWREISLEMGLLTSEVPLFYLSGNRMAAGDRVQSAHGPPGVIVELVMPYSEPARQYGAEALGGAVVERTYDNGKKFRHFLACDGEEWRGLKRLDSKQP